VRYYALFTLVSLAGFSAAAVLVSRAMALAWRFLAAPIDQLSAPRRARWLFCLRLLPTTFAAIVSLALASAFLQFEPRNTNEDAGRLLLCLAALTLGLAGMALARAARSVASDSSLWSLLRHCRQWTSKDGASASILDTTYPVAAVAGVFQPRLVLSARVLRECTPDELDAIVAHERAHVRRRDNLTRALLLALPDRWLAPHVAREIEAAWTRAAEEAADAEGAGAVGSTRAILAATLIRVARMADGAPPAWMPGLAFYQGADLEHRVRALLNEPRRDSHIVILVECAAVTAAVTVTIGSFANSLALHTLIESGVRLLP